MTTRALTIRKKVRRFCLQHTMGGKVDRLEHLTKSLSQNTSLVKKKYEELTIVELEVQDTLKSLQSETFSRENKEIDNLGLLEDKEKEKFKSALIIIKDKGIGDLQPISVSAQRIKGHMLVTLNKAQVQKAILLAKTRLAGNAHLQLETLRVIEKETKGINVELRELLQELDQLNEKAITDFADFQKDVKGMIHKKDGDVNIIEEICTKLEKVDDKGKKTKKKEKAE